MVSDTRGNVAAIDSSLLAPKFEFVGDLADLTQGSSNRPGFYPTSCYTSCESCACDVCSCNSCGVQLETAGAVAPGGPSGR